MSKATSLAAEIKKELGITATLQEGHNGIFEVSINGSVLYTNQGACSNLPVTENILLEISKQKDGSGRTGGIVPTTTLGWCSAPESSKIGKSDCCCTPNVTQSSQKCESNNRSIEIDFFYLDLSTCTRCCNTEANLDEALAEVSRILKSTGVEVIVRKNHVESEDQALELGFMSSPTIRINGKDIQLDVKESLCESCGDICGDDVDCRIWTYQGQEYTAPPKPMIIEAILRAVYGGTDQTAGLPVTSKDIPENLKKFISAKEKKAQENLSAGSCCNTSKTNGGCNC